MTNPNAKTQRRKAFILAATPVDILPIPSRKTQKLSVSLTPPVRVGVAALHQESLAEPNIMRSSRARWKIRKMTTTGMDIMMASEPR